MFVPEIRGVLTGLSLVALALVTATNFNLGVPGEALLGSLRIHTGIALLILPLMLLLTGAWFRALIMLAALALNLAGAAIIIMHQQSLRAPLYAAKPLAEIAVLSFNVLENNSTPAAATAYIAQSGADIVTVLEAKGLGSGLQTLAQIYPYRLGCETVATCDMTVLSKTPLENGRIIPLPPLERLRLITAQTTIRGRVLSIGSMHLSKPYFDEIAPSEMQNIGWALDRLKEPTVVMGDFNAAAWSRDVAYFATQQKLVPGPAYPATWPVSAGAMGIPIDNMFTHGNAVIQSIVATPDSFGSNHRGLLAKVAITGN